MILVFETVGTAVQLCRIIVIIWNKKQYSSHFFSSQCFCTKLVSKESSGVYSNDGLKCSRIQVYVEKVRNSLFRFLVRLHHFCTGCEKQLAVCVRYSTFLKVLGHFTCSYNFFAIVILFKWCSIPLPFKWTKSLNFAWCSNRPLRHHLFHIVCILCLVNWATSLISPTFAVIWSNSLYMVRSWFAISSKFCMCRVLRHVR